MTLGQFWSRMCDHPDSRQTRLMAGLSHLETLDDWQRCDTYIYGILLSTFRAFLL